MWYRFRRQIWRGAARRQFALERSRVASAGDGRNGVALGWSREGLEDGGLCEQGDRVFRRSGFDRILDAGSRFHPLEATDLAGQS